MARHLQPQIALHTSPATKQLCTPCIATRPGYASLDLAVSLRARILAVAVPAQPYTALYSLVLQIEIILIFGSCFSYFR